MKPLPLLLLAACTPTWNTNDGWLSIQAPGMVDLGIAGTANRVLTGTTVSPVLVCASECPEGLVDVDACFDQAVSGEVTGDPEAGEITFEGEGGVTWTFTPTRCDASDLGYEPGRDRLDLVVAPASWPGGTFASPIEGAMASAVSAGTARATLPTGWVPATGEPWLLLENETATLFPRLVGPDSLPVAWQSSTAILESVPFDGVSLTMDEGRVATTLQAGAAASIALVLTAGTFDLGQVQAIAATEATSLEIVPVYVDNEKGGEDPAGARAVLWSSAGKPIYGAPTEWTVDGGLVAGAQLSSGDYVTLTDCLAPSEASGPRTATLTATWGSLSATTTLSWTSTEEAGSDDGWVADPACGGDTGGDSGGDSGGDDSGDDSGDPGDDSGAGDDTGAPADGGGKADEGGCGCAGTGGAAPGMLGALVGLAAIARRRRA